MNKVLSYLKLWTWLKKVRWILATHSVPNGMKSQTWTFFRLLRKIHSHIAIVVRPPSLKSFANQKICQMTEWSYRKTLCRSLVTCKGFFRMTTLWFDEFFNVFEPSRITKRRFSCLLIISATRSQSKILLGFTTPIE